MALTQARTMPGTLELLPPDQIAFQRMLDTVRFNFERFGFLPIETPVMEFTDVLLTKQGGETERQVYFVQSTGALEKSAEGLPELALRFDLTVPLARYVAEHEHDLNFPFRRYQIQRVYRGERAQRGRFREFYQCDIDVIGKDQLSIRYDAEIPAVIYSVFRDLAIGPFTIWLNNRKLMRGFLEGHGIADVKQQAAILREIDKLDKRSQAAVTDTLAGEEFNIPNHVLADIIGLIILESRREEGSALTYLDTIEQSYMKKLPGDPSLMKEGIEELREVLILMRAFRVPETHYAIKMSIARGLDYYTGTVYETTLNEHPQIGSICSGGRYDNLASNYTRSKLPGVGISIGATRLFWQLREAKLLHAAASTVQVLVAQMDETLLPACLEIAAQLRNAGIATEVVMEAGKLGKQFKYADRAGIRFVAVLGPDEVAKGTVTVKDMRKQDQVEMSRADLASTLRAQLAQEAPA
ncbi:MAG: histidine--tRNA ligase [Proteobacteria bacterium]|nr:histidine--tRNA ligase [Pseudomonadota bacterium]